MSKGIKSTVGDVFLVPLGNGKFSVGQIISCWREELYIVIYNECVDHNKFSAKDVADKEPIFAALSLDAKLWCGHWQIIGNFTENLAKIHQPVFKVYVNGSLVLESRDRSIFRHSSQEVASKLNFRTVVAPIILEQAIKAHHKLLEWDFKYDELSYQYAVESSKLLLH